MNKEQIKIIGFDQQKEEIFLGRLPSDCRRVSLEQELKTQLAEDFGFIRFTSKYGFSEEGKIIDILSGQEIVELTRRGGIEEETESIRKIEQSLRENQKQTWIHFSPKNEKLGYPENCVDFWRVVDKKVIWNRIVVNNSFEEMKTVRRILSGEEREIKDEMEILSLPIGTENLRLADLFDYFRLSNKENRFDLEKIELVVKKYLDKFESNFGQKITEDSDLIFRLYSACFKDLREEKTLDRREMDDFMFGVMTRMITEKSFGCSVTTTIGEFGQKIGYFVSENGKVNFGEIPEGFKECKKCGCWYKGEKCPFC